VILLPQTTSAVQKCTFGGGGVTVKVSVNMRLVSLITVGEFNHAQVSLITCLVS
jgi:hypothetical protein